MAKKHHKTGDSGNLAVADRGRTAADICHPTICIQADVRNSEVLAIFNNDLSLNCLPVIDAGEIIGLINRHRFMGTMAGRFHWEIYSKKRCTKMMDASPLVIEADTPIREVANMLLHDARTPLLPESFIVASKGEFMGTGYVSDVLALLLQYEQQAAAELRQHRDNLAEMVEIRTHDLEIARKAAEHASRAKSEFLANISHELRTPLHAVLAFTQLGKQKGADAERERLIQYFRRIDESALRLKYLVDDLLDISKLEAGQMVLKLAQADLRDLINRTRDELSNFAAQRQIDICCDYRVESALIECDADRICQVLSNLLHNACKFSAEGSQVDMILIPRCSRDQDQERGYRVMVIDRGPGIPETELNSIFERFTQSSLTRTGAGGTGLGLTISREIMKLHHGNISARNNPDGGACFMIDFQHSRPE